MYISDHSQISREESEQKKTKTKKIEKTIKFIYMNMNKKLTKRKRERKQNYIVIYRVESIICNIIKDMECIVEKKRNTSII
jgi:hypothetical protein